jgi:hypothetical protein
MLEWTVQMEVQNFYPWLCGRGILARVGVWIMRTPNSGSTAW